MSLSGGWIGVDLDGTLAIYDGWKGADHIGAPIAPMVDRVKRWIAEGKEVRIFTARAFPGDTVERCMEAATAVEHIQKWCYLHLGQALPVTCVKDYGMIELWDDRAHRVVANTGFTCCGA